MAKNVNDSQKQEIKRLKDWCLTVLDYLITKHSEDKMHWEVAKSAFLDGLETANLKGMKMAHRDFAALYFILVKSPVTFSL